MFKRISKSRAGIAVSAAVMAGQTFAAEGAVDYSQLTSSIDFSGAITAVMAVAVSIAALFAAIFGAKVVLGFLRR